MNKRIVTRIKQDDYDKLIRIHKEYGFKSVYQMIRSLVTVFADHVEPIQEPQQSLDDEIKDMFGNLSDSQAPRYDKHVRPRNRTIYEQESKIY